MSDIFKLMTNSLDEALASYRPPEDREEEEPVIMDSTIEEKLVKIRDAGAILEKRAREADRQIKLIQDYLTNECVTVAAHVRCPKEAFTLGYGELDDPTSYTGRDRRKVWKLWADTSLTDEDTKSLLLCSPRTRIRAIEFLPKLLDEILRQIKEENK